MSDSADATSIKSSITILSGFAFPSHGFNQIEGLPLIRIRDLAGSTTEIKFKGLYDAAYVVRNGEVLIGMDGDFEVHRWAGDLALLNQRVCKVSASHAEIDQQFLYWYLKPKIADIHRRTPQTTVRHLSTKEIYAIIRPSIDSEDQAIVAKILDTLDTAIHETEAIIAKLKAVKQGLLHDLLTRGIDANGELRPPQTEAPHLYKQSLLGWIPKEWRTSLIGEEADIQHGFAFPGHLFTSEPKGYRLLVPGNFSRFGGLDFCAGNTKYFDGQHPTGALLGDGEILIVMTDLSPMTLILGRVALLDEGFPVLHNQRIGKFVLRRPSEWYPQFFVMLMNDDRLRQKVISEATGTTVRHTSPDRIKTGVVVKPSIKEQTEAARRVDTLSVQISVEHANCTKLRHAKSALMDDLLTGRVRVTPLLSPTEQPA